MASLKNVHSTHSERVAREQVTGRGNILFECWMESVYGNYFNDVPWKKLFSLKKNQRLYQLKKTVKSVTVALIFNPLQRQRKMLPLPSQKGSHLCQKAEGAPRRTPAKIKA